MSAEPEHSGILLQACSFSVVWPPRISCIRCFLCLLRRGAAHANAGCATTTLQRREQLRNCCNRQTAAASRQQGAEVSDSGAEVFMGPVCTNSLYFLPYKTRPVEQKEKARKPPGLLASALTGVGFNQSNVDWQSTSSLFSLEHHRPQLPQQRWCPLHQSALHALLPFQPAGASAAPALSPPACPFRPKCLSASLN